jgi:hypothetical protein
MFWRREYTLCGEVGGGWALEFPSFLGPVKWQRADRRVPFGATGSSQCWSVGQPVHSFLLPPTMAAAGIPVSAPSTLPNSVDIQQRIESAPQPGHVQRFCVIPVVGLSLHRSQLF